MWPLKTARTPTAATLLGEQAARVPRLVHKGFVGVEVSGQVVGWLGGQMARWMTKWLCGDGGGVAGAWWWVVWVGE